MSESNTAPTRSSYRVVLLGDQGVGKSSISLRFLRDEFHEHNAPTIGGKTVAGFLTRLHPDEKTYIASHLLATLEAIRSTSAYLTQTLKVGDRTVKLDLWDTAGQERFASLAPMYYRTAQGAIVVYDVCSKNGKWAKQPVNDVNESTKTDTASFVRAKDWVKELKTQAPAGTIVMLCGNKIDIPDGREVSIEDGVQMAKDKGLIFAEVSAKSGQGVKSIFQAIAEKIVAKDSHSANSAPPQDKGIRLSSNEKASSGCRCSSQQTA